MEKGYSIIISPNVDENGNIKHTLLFQKVAKKQIETEEEDVTVLNWTEPESRIDDDNLPEEKLNQIIEILNG